MRFSSAIRPGGFFLALGLLQVVGYAQPASAFDRVVINNGLAPPNPENVLDHGAFRNDGVYIRNVGCGDPVAYARCQSPGDPTDAEMLAGGKAGFLVTPPRLLITRVSSALILIFSSRRV